MTREDVAVGRALDVQTTFTAVASAATAMILPADGNRVGVVVADSTIGNLFGGQSVMVGTLVGGSFLCVGRIVLESPSVELDIGRYGSIITGPLYVNNQTGGNLTIAVTATRLLRPVGLPG